MSQRIIHSDLKRVKQLIIIILNIAKKLFLLRYQLEMETQFTFDEMTTSPVSPAYFSSEEEEEMDVDLLSVSVEGTGRHSDDSDFEVIACYRHVLVTQSKPNVPRKLTTDLSGCADDGFPGFTSVGRLSRPVARRISTHKSRAWDGSERIGTRKQLS